MVEFLCNFLLSPLAVRYRFVQELVVLIEDKTDKPLLRKRVMESKMKPGKKKESVKNPVKSSPTTSRWRNEQNQVNLKHFDIN